MQDIEIIDSEIIEISIKIIKEFIRRRIVYEGKIGKM